MPKCFVVLQVTNSGFPGIRLFLRFRIKTSVAFLSRDEARKLGLWLIAASAEKELPK